MDVSAVIGSEGTSKEVGGPSGCGKVELCDGPLVTHTRRGQGIQLRGVRRGTPIRVQIKSPVRHVGIATQRIRTGGVP